MHPRLRALAAPLAFVWTTLVVLAPPAHAKDIDPVGAGDMLPSPTKSVPEGQGTLYEEYGDELTLWRLDVDYGWTDVEGAIHWIADLFNMGTLLITRATIVSVQWMFELLTIPELQQHMTAAISGASKGLMVTLLPAALALGALAAFAGNKQARGSQLSQLAWVALSAVFAISLLTTPKVWIDGVGAARTIGADAAMNAGSAGIGEGVTDFPFAMDHKPTYTDDKRDTMMRKSSDAIWRVYAATPWCLAEFGSLEVCKEHGLGVLKTDTFDTKERKDEYLDEKVSSEAVGDDSVEWRQGHNPVGRIMVTLIGFIAVLAFAVLVISLAFASIASFLGVLMLFVAGVFFASLWCIPGRPRQWGVKFFDFALGLTLQSSVAMVTLTSLLILQTGIANLMGTYGWGVCAGLSMAAAVAAWKFRRILESIVGVSGSMGPGGMVAGLLAARGASKLAGGLLKGAGRGILKGGVRGRGPAQRPGGGGEGPLSGRIDRIPKNPFPQLPGRNYPQLPPGGASAGVPRGPKQPLPAGGAAAPLPGGNQPAMTGRASARSELPPGQAAGRGRSVADGPTQTGSLPAGASRTQTGTAPHPRQSRRPSPLLRGSSDPSSYTFRQNPRPGTSAPKVIKGEVISRTDRPAGRPAAPAGPGRRPRRPTPAPTTRRARQ